MGNAAGCLAMKELFGDLEDVIAPGCLCAPWCVRSHLAGYHSLRVNRLNVRCETKTMDNVFVTLVASVQYRELTDKPDGAYYKLSNTRKHIKDNMFHVIWDTVPKLTLDSVFEQKNDIAQSFDRQLKKAMCIFGYEIVQIMIVDIEVDEHTKISMNEITTATRKMVAAKAKADAEKLVQIKKGMGMANVEAFSGAGISWKQQDTAEGIRKKVLDFTATVPGASAKDVMDMILVNQYFDTIKEIGASPKSTTVFLPHEPRDLKDVAPFIRDGIMIQTRDEIATLPTETTESQISHFGVTESPTE